VKSGSSVRERNGDRRALGHDEIAPRGGRREHTVVGELMGARGWKVSLGSSRSDESQGRLGVVAKRISLRSRSMKVSGSNDPADVPSRQ
jgi:hypothetical protein